MPITPVDITHTQFRTSFRGYDKEEVDAFVRSVKESLEQVLTEKSELQRKLETLQEELERIKKIEATMSSALTLAQRTADDIRANARRQAEMILQEAEQARVRMTIEAQKEVERLRIEIGRLEGVRDRLAAELSSTLEAFRELLEKRVIASPEPDSIDTTSGSKNSGSPQSAECASGAPSSDADEVKSMSDDLSGSSKPAEVA